MGEIIVRRISERGNSNGGRLSLPGEVLEEIDSQDVFVEFVDGEIRLIPVSEIDIN